MTTARADSPAVCIVNKTMLIVCGGARDRRVLETCEMLDLTNKTAGWTLIASMDVSRRLTSGTLLPDGYTFLVISGDGYDTAESSCEKLDIISGTWSFAGNLSLGARDSHRSILYKDNVIVLGGFIGGYNGGVPTNTCEQYDAIANTWSQFQPSFINARHDFGAAVVLDKIYIAGGLDVNEEALSSVEVFSGTSWSNLPSSLAQAQSGCSAVSFQNKLTVLGGDLDTSTIEVFDPVTSTWNTTFPPMIIVPSRVSFAAVSF